MVMETETFKNSFKSEMYHFENASFLVWMGENGDL